MRDMRKILICLILAVTCAACGRRVAQADGPGIRARSADTENGRAESAGALQFEPELLDLGEIPLGESRDVQVVATNGTGKPLAVLDVYTSCHCTKIRWDKKPLAPGDKMIIDVRYTAEDPGTFFKKIVVRHSAAQAPATFAIQGTVVSAK